jgi:hypothetical protein
MSENLDIVFKILSQIENFDESQKRVFYLIFDEIANFREWRKDLPYISWPSEWEVKFYPSLTALLRGIVRLKSNPQRQVSFYFDGHAYLGAMYDYGKIFSNHTQKLIPTPYWEIYNLSDPMGEKEDAGPERYYMNEIDELLEGIRRMLMGENHDTE